MQMYKYANVIQFPCAAPVSGHDVLASAVHTFHTSISLSEERERNKVYVQSITKLDLDILWIQVYWLTMCRKRSEIDTVHSKGSQMTKVHCGQIFGPIIPVGCFGKCSHVLHRKGSGF